MKETKLRGCGYKYPDSNKMFVDLLGQVALKNSSGQGGGIWKRMSSKNVLKGSAKNSDERQRGFKRNLECRTNANNYS